MKDPHDPELCPYCASMLFMGRGIKQSLKAEAKDKLDHDKLLIGLAAFLSPAIELLTAQCERKRGLHKANAKNLN